MAKIYIDVNYFIGLVDKTRGTNPQVISSHLCSISVLTCQILFYVNKIKAPNEKLEEYLNQFELVSLTSETIKNSLQGPLDDLEDNIQLHSCASANCDYFLTFDKKLLKMKYFGKTKIVNSL